MGSIKRYRHWRDHAGIAAVEFALIAPVFLILVFGIIIYGFYFATYIAVAHAASEGARASVAGLTDAERASLAEAQVHEVFASYGALLPDDAAHLDVVAQPSATAGLFEVSVHYDLSERGFSRFAGFLPLPSDRPGTTVVAAHGGY